MSMLDNLVDAVLASIPPPPLDVTVGTIATVNLAVQAPRSLFVRYGGSEPVSARWTGSFDLTLSVTGAALVGTKVLLVFVDGQPIIVDVIIGA